MSSPPCAGLSCGRTVAAHLGLPVTVFPGDHGGFLGGEYGQPVGDPEGFAAKLLSVLDRDPGDRTSGGSAGVRR